MLFLLLYNLGGFLSFLQVTDDQRAMMFVITSIYMAISAIIFSFYVAHDPLRRMAVIRNGLVIAAVIVSVLVFSATSMWPALAESFSRYSRAVGTFKDPNVFSTYLLFPGIMLVQGFMLGHAPPQVHGHGGLFIVLAALFLAFSRGAWISFLAATAIMVRRLTFILTPSTGTRSRIILITLFGAHRPRAIAALLLSVEGVRDLFLDRFTLAKQYDSGEKGRFGNQLNSIPLLLQQPLGFGPLYFQIFGMDPHNVYINGFASYGWLGGISYPVDDRTIVIGFKTVLMRTPWQNWAIVVFCPLLTTIFQGVQIDTDHWRHFYWMLG